MFTSFSNFYSTVVADTNMILLLLFCGARQFKVNYLVMHF